MNKKLWITIYLAALIVDLIAVYSNNDTLRFVTKPMLMPLLVGYFITNISAIASPLKKWIIFALVFSWLGDVLLMFEKENSSFFIFGLVAFLIAHVFYIILFDQVRVKEKIKQSLLPLLPIAIYYILLMSLLQPSLGKMQKPVSVYGLVISIMLSFAIDLWRLKDRIASGFIILGALLFITSD